MSSRPTTYLVSLVLLCLAASSFANAATATRPRVDFSTYLSGNDYTEVTASTVDSKGYLYLAGYTWADDFPTTAGAFLRTPRTVCTDSCRSHATFVVKLNRHGNGLIYSTFINEAAPTDIAVDPAGNAYLTGSRVEDDYAGTTGTLHTKCSNGANPGGCNWLAKLNSTGSAIVFSTIINETTQCWYNAKIGLNPKNEIYLADAAYTFSPCPTTVNAFRKSVSSAATAVQVMKFSADGKSLLFSTFVSSPDPYDSIANLVVDRNDHAIVAGTTLRPYFPVTQSAFQKTRRNGSQTAYISKISSDGSTLLASTLLGGSNPTESYGLEVDHDLNVYVAGLTYSYDFPTTPGAYQRQHEPRGNCGEGSSILDCPDMFITKLPPNFGSLLYSTYYGTPGDESFFAFGIDPVGHAYIAGWPNNVFPPKVNAFQTELGNMFVSKFSTKADRLLFSSNLGGPYSYDPFSFRLIVDLAGNAYLPGSTWSKDLDTTPGALQPSKLSPSTAGFAVKVDIPPCTLSSTIPSITICSPASGTPVKSPFLFGAGATNDRDISGMVLYVDGVKKYTIDNASHFDTRLSLSVGTHNLTIKAWDTSGRVTSKSQTVAVQ